MRERILDRLASLCIERSKLILFIAFLLLIVAIAGITRLRFDPELLNSIPQKNREVSEFKKVLTEMGTVDYHVAVLSIPPGHEASEYESLITSIAEAFKKRTDVEDVQYRIPNPLQFIDELLPQSLLLLTPEELQKVGDALSTEGIQRSVSRNRALLQTPQAIAIKKLVTYDPFNLLPIYMSKFQSTGSGLRVDLASGYYLSEDHTTLIILVKPAKPAQDLMFARQLVAGTEQITQKATAEFQRAHPTLPLPKIDYAGGYAIATEDSELIKKDLVVNELFSVIGILALFLYAFRRPMSVVYAGVPMLLAIALTFALAGVLYGELSSASAGFAALIAGLGIDFITVVYGRYVDERNRGATLEEGIRIIMKKTLPGVTVAALTSAATFYAFLITEFRGMSELGSLTASGILIFLAAVMFVLPALIVQSEKNRARAPKLFMHSFGSEHLLEYSIQNPRRVLTWWLVLLSICAVLATRVRFSDDVKNLRASGNHGVKTQSLLRDKFGQSFDFMMFVTEGRTSDEALARTQAANEDLKQLVKNGSIASFQSIASFLPPQQQQLEVIQTLQAGRADRFSADRINRDFQSALRENGFRPEVYDNYMTLFSRALIVSKPMGLDQLRNDDLRRLATRFIKKTKSGWLSVTYLYPTKGSWGRQTPPQLRELPAKHPGSILTSVSIVSQALRKVVRSDATWATLLGFFLVFVILAATFRSPARAALIFVPFIAGGTVMVGLMAVVGAEFNFINIFIGLMLVGVATDYAVYMMQRYFEDPAAFAANGPETAKAVIMAALTAMVGFGSFAISHYPGLRSIGYASALGIGFSALATVTLLPAILQMKGGRFVRRKE